MKKICNIALVILFLGVIISVPILNLTVKEKEFSENENRYLAKKPVLSVAAVKSGKYMQDVEQYVNDQFPSRDTWIGVKSKVQQWMGRTEINGVYLGKNGYLINAWQEKDVNQNLLNANVNTLKQFIANNNEMDVSVLIAPTSGLILKDKLPDNAPIFDENIALDKIKKELGSKASVIDIRNVLKEHKNEYIYYKTDHHWTTLGAFYGYSQWKAEKGEKVSLADYNVEKVTDSFRGTLFSRVLDEKCVFDDIQLFLPKKENLYTISFENGKRQDTSIYDTSKLEEKDKYQVFFGGNYSEMTIKTANKNGKRLLVIKDSYANAFIPFLLNDYEAIHVIDLRYYSQRLKEYIKKNAINEALILYNVKNFCEDKSVGKLKLD